MKRREFRLERQDIVETVEVHWRGQEALVERNIRLDMVSVLEQAMY